VVHQILGMRTLKVAIRITPSGTRGAKLPKCGRLVRQSVQGPGQLDGESAPVFGRHPTQPHDGFPVVILTRRGAKTGQERTATVGGFQDGPDSWLVVASLAGAARHPAWFTNMANDIWFEIGKERFKVRGESLEGSERTEALARTAAIARRSGSYQEKTDREIPIVRLTREPS
jgi:deazaflavin-dependent oxidoreductase (nitroreductase family)